MNQETRTPPPLVEEQLQAIHAMLGAGHRGIRLEPHSLALWGAIGATLMLVTPRVAFHLRLPLVWQEAGLELLFLAMAVALAGAVDFWVTRRARRRRDETLPFIQRQMGKVWLLLAGLGLVASYGMHSIGDGAMVYVLWMLLLGIGLFTHGLFSEQSLGWFGGATISLGAGALALHLPADSARWLAILVFGVGLPALGLLLRPLDKLPRSLRLACLLGWLLMVIGGALAAYRADRSIHQPAASPLTLERFRRQEAVHGQIVSLPPGTVVPVRITLSGDMFAQAKAISVPLELTRGLDLALIDGQLDGQFRVPGGDWKDYRYHLSIPEQRLVANLTREDGLVLDYALRVVTNY